MFSLVRNTIILLLLNCILYKRDGYYHCMSKVTHLCFDKSGSFFGFWMQNYLNDFIIFSSLLVDKGVNGQKDWVSKKRGKGMA